MESCNVLNWRKTRGYMRKFKGIHDCTFEILAVNRQQQNTKVKESPKKLQAETECFQLL